FGRTQLGIVALCKHETAPVRVEVIEERPAPREKTRPELERFFGIASAERSARAIDRSCGGAQRGTRAFFLRVSGRVKRLSVRGEHGFGTVGIEPCLATERPANSEGGGEMRKHAFPSSDALAAR